jgi:hypothetical protein
MPDDIPLSPDVSVRLDRVLVLTLVELLGHVLGDEPRRPLLDEERRLLSEGVEAFIDALL